MTYTFFWDEFADWFIEASKSRAYGQDEGAASTSRAVLVYVLDKVLRLLHPFMPFVTEELWQAIPHQGDALIIAQWPRPGMAQDQTALSHFSSIQALVRSIRNARAQYGVEEKKKIAATLVCEEPSLRSAMSAELPAIALLAKLDLSLSSVSQSGLVASSSIVSLVVEDGVQVQLPMAGLFDVEKEMARLNKQKAKIEKDLGGLDTKLNNPKFMEKASPENVAETRQQQVEAREKLAMVMEQISKLTKL